LLRKSFAGEMDPRFRGDDNVGECRDLLFFRRMEMKFEVARLETTLATERSASIDARFPFAIVAVLALVWIHAALELRPLFGDGFHYLVRLLERETFWLEAPARRTVELVRQLPVLAALKLGIGGVETLALVWGLSMLLLPLALTALCWPALPRARRHFFAFPLLHYCAGTLGAAFAPVNEGATAAAWFWLLFFLLLFRPARAGALALVAALAAGTVLLHEGMALLAPILAAASVWRAKRETGRGARAVYVGLAIWFAVVAAVQAGFIVDPSHPTNRTSFFTALFSFWWLWSLWGSLNLPALFGFLALTILALLVIVQLRSTRRGALRAPFLRLHDASSAEVAGAADCETQDMVPAEAGRARRAPTRQTLVFTAFGVAILAAIIGAIAADQMFAAQAQFNARNHSLLISVPLALIAFYVAVKPATAARLPFRAAIILSAWLAAASALWHVEATRRWSAYVGVFREVLAGNAGLVVWEDVLAKLPPRQARVFEGFSHFWIEPMMSIVLAPGGKVAAIVAARRAARWYPFDARKPEDLPRSRYWNYDAYLAAPKK
jgi:hypothetical protein